jgi:hypothetical protein
MKEITVTTTTENEADFGFSAPNSLLTLTLHAYQNNNTFRYTSEIDICQKKTKTSEIDIKKLIC